MKEEILKALEFYEIKKSKVESDLGMPKNSLSAMLAGKKEIPKKWVEALRKYVDDLNNPQKDLETLKEAKQEPETEKAVESTQNQEVPPKTLVSDKYSNPIGELDGYQKLDFEELKKQPIVEANQTFDQLLKQFNNLVELTEKPKDIKLKLEQIKESAKNSNLTPRQTDAIVDRANHFLNNNYNQSKHNLKLS